MGKSSSVNSEESEESELLSGSDFFGDDFDNQTTFRPIASPTLFYGEQPKDPSPILAQASSSHPDELIQSAQKRRNLNQYGRGDCLCNFPDTAKMAFFHRLKPLLRKWYKQLSQLPEPSDYLEYIETLLGDNDAEINSATDTDDCFIQLLRDCYEIPNYQGFIDLCRLRTESFGKTGEDFLLIINEVFFYYVEREKPLKENFMTALFEEYREILHADLLNHQNQESTILLPVIESHFLPLIYSLLYFYETTLEDIDRLKEALENFMPAIHKLLFMEASNEACDVLIETIKEIVSILENDSENHAYPTP